MSRHRPPWSIAARGAGSSSSANSRRLPLPAQENGFTNTTVEQIANAADYSVSTFFRLFPARKT